ncbi:hypothetical protein Y032_0002g570 [Ancylostoma ceylanicum]|uniref:Reverse transcriptase domain-containing protein n=1 Tax=Ancylostoma ceylanicum TaxID=53326 RepID=A0A016W257_9BILA|nr:hypothetical protein Y032_0002g570 [Ancylostoma ceylanicum]
MLASKDKHELELQTQAWSDRLAQFGLRLNVNKTKYLTIDVNVNGTVRDDDIDLPRTDAFKYFGSTVTSDGSLSRDVLARFNSSCIKWCYVNGVLCCKSIPNSKVHRMVVCAVAHYGDECRTAIKEVERPFSVMEMEMLSWMASTTRLDRICNPRHTAAFWRRSNNGRAPRGRMRWYPCPQRQKICRIGFILGATGK